MNNVSMTKMEIEILADGVMFKANRNDKQLQVTKTFYEWETTDIEVLAETISEAMFCSLQDSYYMIDLVDTDIVESGEYASYVNKEGAK